MDPSVTVAIPVHPPRLHNGMLARALESVWAQTVSVPAISVAVDVDREGAGPTRTRAMQQVRTHWIAFMDSDDELLPHHLETLLRHAEETGADVVWPWFQVVGGGDPIACNRGKQWDPSSPHTFPITTLVRNELAQQLAFNPPLSEVGCSGEDFAFWIHMSDLGAQFSHIDEVTWIWRHDSQNTAGLPSRWA